MSNKISYFNQLDSLRALAVIMTILVHYLPDIGFHKIPYMYMGVDLFFAISGFLITSILLKTKASYDKPNKLTIIKNFIIRRSLRLFPIFYIYLLFFVALSITGLWLWRKGDAIYYFTYTANILFYKVGFQSVCFNHIWSLCVEEQFYLVWPWLLIFLPMKIFKKIIYLYIFIGIFSCIYFDDTFIRLLPFANFHTLGAGALLSYLWFYSKENKYFIHFTTHTKTYFIITFTILISFLVACETHIITFAHLQVKDGIRESMVPIVLFFLLLSTLTGWNRIAGKLMNNNFMQYLGRISYGIYLLHKPIPFLITLALGKLHLTFHNPPLQFITYMLLTLLIASVSYKYIETPFLKLKEKFDK